MGRKKDGRTKTGFSYGPSTINRASREMLGEVEGMADMPEVLPKKKFYKPDDEEARRRSGK